jgi:hypothetical protein
VDVSKLSISELKATFYDELVKRDVAQANLDIINQELARQKPGPYQRCTVLGCLL